MKNGIVLKKDGYAIPEKDVYTGYIQRVAELTEGYFSKKRIRPKKRGSLFVCSVFPFPELTEILRNERLIEENEYAGISGSAGLGKGADKTGYQILIQKVACSRSFKLLDQAEVDACEKKLIKTDLLLSSDVVKCLIKNSLDLSPGLSDAINSMDISFGENKTILRINWNGEGVKNGFYVTKSNETYYF